jgi:transcriptional regulator with XRE-family HTH domain
MKRSPVERSSAERVAEAVRVASERSGISIRELAHVSRVSTAQINRLRAAETHARGDTLVKLARAFGRNPNLLFIVAGDLRGEEARQILGSVFRDGSEHIEVWKWEGHSVEQARQAIDDPATDDDALAELALSVFLGQESEENLWRDPFLGSVVEGEDAPLIRALLREWAYLTEERKRKVVEYVTDQAELSRREGVDQMRKEIPDYGKP